MATKSLSLYSNAELNVISQCHVGWRFESWLHAYPLTSQTVFDYFKHSVFYDATCNNEIAQMQNIQTNQNGVVSGNAQSTLQSLVGVEFSLDQGCNDTYFVIRKSFRRSPTAVDLLALFYVVAIEPASSRDPQKGTIFQLPSVSVLSQTSLTTAIYHINQTVGKLQQQFAGLDTKIETISNSDSDEEESVSEIDDEIAQEPTEQDLSDDKSNRTEFQAINPGLMIAYSSVIDNILNTLLR